ncbi:tyrosine-type recombinase/integrase [Microbispora sp. NBC_01189]|nr:tyrosine-type recombinase/integrase [Microbispora sp. NBC_01189]
MSGTDALIGRVTSRDDPPRDDLSRDERGVIDAVWKLESARIVAGLARMVGDVGLAEELAQEAVLAALEQWPASGTPDNPGAWLTAVAKRRAVDHLRREDRHGRGQERLAHDLATRPGDDAREMDDVLGAVDGEVGDDVLRLMFVSCHPVLSAESRVALTLRLVGGLRTDEIARAFLVTETAVAQRIVRAKRALADAGVPFEVPSEPDRTARLASVLEVVYLVFNEGYSVTAGDDLMRPSLCLEALRLGRLLAGLVPGEAEAHGLVALMELQQSRSAARTGPSGEPVVLHEQNRGRWDRLLIRRGFAALLRARQAGGPLGPYVLQAAVAACHAGAATAEETDWPRIAALYDALVQVLPTPVVRLNRAVALAMAYGPDAGLALADTLTGEPALAGYHLLPAVRGDLLARLGRRDEARAEFERAASLTRNAPEREVLLRRAATCSGGVVLGEAVRAFLARPGLTAGTLRSYGQTLSRLCLRLGADLPLEEATPQRVAEVFAAEWGTAAGATWNRHRAALRSFAAWAAGHGLKSADLSADLAAALDRRPEPRGRVRPIARSHLEDLWARPDVAPRERALWMLLYESAAPAEWALSLDVQDLDLRGMSAVVRGRRRRIRWEAGTAALLPPLVGDRRRGPLFRTDRRPGPGRASATADLCPHTGRSRLSYERAEHLFKRATRDLDPGGEGYTLHRLRHSRLAHLAEDGWTAPMLMSLSGHTSARTLREFVRAGQPAEVTAGPPCPPPERPRMPARPPGRAASRPAGDQG